MPPTAEVVGYATQRHLPGKNCRSFAQVAARELADSGVVHGLDDVEQCGWGLEGEDVAARALPRPVLVGDHAMLERLIPPDEIVDALPDAGIERIEGLVDVGLEQLDLLVGDQAPDEQGAVSADTAPEGLDREVVPRDLWYELAREQILDAVHRIGLRVMRWAGYAGTPGDAVPPAWRSIARSRWSLFRSVSSRISASIRSASPRVSATAGRRLRRVDDRPAAAHAPCRSPHHPSRLTGSCSRRLHGLRASLDPPPQRPPPPPPPPAPSPEESRKVHEVDEDEQLILRKGQPQHNLVAYMECDQTRGRQPSGRIHPASRSVKPAR